MNKNTFFIAAFLGMLAPQVQAAPYVGVGVGYKSIDVDDVSGFNKGTYPGVPIPGFSFEFEKPYTYADDYQGFSFLAGYRFKDSPWAVELNYFKSSVSKSKFIDLSRGRATANTKIQIESFSVDVIGHYPLSSLNKVSLLGAVGVLHQKMNVVGEYREPMTSGGGDNPTFSVYNDKKDVFDTRLQLGVGMQYDLSEAISTRAMLSVIPSGFSMTKGTPYSMNASVLYHF